MIPPPVDSLARDAESDVHCGITNGHRRFQTGPPQVVLVGPLPCACDCLQQWTGAVDIHRSFLGEQQGKDVRPAADPCAVLHMKTCERTWLCD